MEIRILEETKERLKIEVQGEDHTFCNILKKELWNGKNVKIAGYQIAHPLIGNPVIIVESDKDPKKALLDAVERLQNKNKELLKLVKKLA